MINDDLFRAVLCFMIDSNYSLLLVFVFYLSRHIGDIELFAASCYSYIVNHARIGISVLMLPIINLSP